MSLEMKGRKMKLAAILFPLKIKIQAIFYIFPSIIPMSYGAGPLKLLSK